MDVARTAFRQGSDKVTIISNSDEESITARNIELAYAKIDGAKIIFNKTAVEFTDKGVILADSQMSEDGGAIIPVKGSEALFSADSCIIAIGQGPRAVIVSSTTGIGVSERGLVETDSFGKTSRKGIFASGDVVTGAKTVVEAVKVSRRVAQAMDEYVQSIVD